MTLRPGVLIDHTELMTRPTTGAAWNAVLASAKAMTASGGDLSNQDGGAKGRAVLATALAGVRLGDQALINKAKTAMTATIGTDKGARWLAIGRTLIPYVVAADVMDIRSGPIFDGLKLFRTKTLQDNNNSSLQQTFAQDTWSSGSNASAQEGAGYAALLVYLGDKAELDKEYIKFRKYLGDRTSLHKLVSNDPDWQAIPSEPVGIQNVGAKSAKGIDIAGAISNDMARSNPEPVTNLVFVDFSHYPWVGTEGSVLSAYIFNRQGYPAFDVADKALLRAANYLNKLAQKDSGWYDATTRKDVKYIINKHYGVNLPELKDANGVVHKGIKLPVGESGLTGWTDWMIG